jgi:hypothetical protein
MSLRSRLAMLVPLAACDHREARPIPALPPDVLVSIRADTVETPDSIGPGWARVRVEEDGRGHIVVIFRLSEGATDADLAAFLTALDTASATPPQAIALGGPEVGDVGEVVVELTSGRYVIACVRRGRQGHRHASMGEARLLVVTSEPVTASRESPPTATQELRLVDFAYVGPDRWPAGSHMLRIESGGQQEHQLRLALLRSGASIQDWMSAAGSGKIARTVAGVARMGPGAVAYLPIELAAGTYVAYCLITDPTSGREHVTMGMVRAIQVAPRAVIH